MGNVDDTFYVLGSVVGPHPYPEIVRDFQTVIGREIKQQILRIENRMPDHMIACVGGGSNSIGMFYPFLREESIELTGVEAGGRSSKSGENAARLGGLPEVGILQGYKSYFLQDKWGQVLKTHSISAGLDYAGIGPELAALYQNKRIKFVHVSDSEALSAYKYLSSTEGIIPALESAHAVAYVLKTAENYKNDRILIINISGRGDKDIFISAKELDKVNWREFLKQAVNL
jgi:tryptophan synthase beta chain